jgi:hypothetical protein
VKVEMSVQDDQRERELCRLFNLEWDPAHERSGTDAFFLIDTAVGQFRVEVEVKSTTGGSVSTARDVGMEHVKKWRRMFWVIGYYSKGGLKLTTCLCLSPAQIAPWIESIDDKIRPDYLLAELAPSHLTLADLAAVCGLKETYTIEDAKRLHKRQWTAQQYAAASDIVVSGRPMISPRGMLEILRLRARYIAERGATLNNPHIEKGFLAQFLGTESEVLRDQAAAIRVLARKYIESGAVHPFPLVE